MELYIGDKVVNFDKNKFEKLGEGQTSITYRNGNEVFKLFYDTGDEEFYKYFVDCDIDLKLISRPLNLIYNGNNKLIGTSTYYIDGVGEFYNYYIQLLNMFKNEFWENFNIMRDDLNNLSKYGIIVGDIGIHNCKYWDSKIYHVDYGDFKRGIDSFKINNEVFDIFIENIMCHIYRKYHGYVPHWMLYSDDCFKILNDNMSDNETVKQFVRKMI